MGVSGSGKSTIGNLLAAKLGCAFLEGDTFHSAANKEKMASGIPLTDSDRLPWLETLSAAARGLASQGQTVVVACSALKSSYRDYFSFPELKTIFIWLDGSRELIGERLKSRVHFMNPALLESQFETLEAPKSAMRIDVSAQPRDIVLTICEHLGPFAPLRSPENSVQSTRK